MEKEYKILFVDDDKRYAEPLLEKAYSDYKINLDFYDNWEEAITQLDDDFESYHAVIIDGKGKKTKDDKGDDESHVVKAVKDLCKRIGRGLFIPYVVLSAYIDLKEKEYAEMFFEKNKDEDAMFKFLIIEIQNSKIEKLKTKYPKAFNVFDNNIIDSKYRHILIEMLSCLEEKDYKKKNLNVIRDLLEAFFLTLTNNYECIPESFKNNKGNPNHAWCTRFFTGQPTNDGAGEAHTIGFIIPEHISWSISYTKELSNGFSHLSENETLKNPFISAAYAMLVQ